MQWLVEHLDTQIGFLTAFVAVVLLFVLLEVGATLWFRLQKWWTGRE